MVSQVVKSVAARVQDNNKSRQLCHKAFCQSKDLIYIDSGNGEFSGRTGICDRLTTLMTLFSAWKNSFASTVALTPLSSSVFLKSSASAGILKAK